MWSQPTQEINAERRYWQGQATLACHSCRSENVTCSTFRSRLSRCKSSEPRMSCPMKMSLYSNRLRCSNQAATSSVPHWCTVGKPRAVPPSVPTIPKAKRNAQPSPASNEEAHRNFRECRVKRNFKRIQWISEHAMQPGDRHSCWNEIHAFKAPSYNIKCIKTF